MKQLTLGDLLSHIAILREGGMEMNEIRALPIYLGNDDELNGIHCAWFTNLIDSNKIEDEDDRYLIDMINEDRCNIKLVGKAILIS